MRNIYLQQIRTRMDWDRLAIGLSALCGIHCFATTILIGAAATAGGFLHNPLVHELGLVFALLLGGLALGTGLLRHNLILPSLVGGIGLAAMAGALTLPHGALESAITAVGVAILAIAHLLNRRALRRCEH